MLRDYSLVTSCCGNGVAGSGGFPFLVVDAQALWRVDLIWNGRLVANMAIVVSRHFHEFVAVICAVQLRRNLLEDDAGRHVHVADHARDHSVNWFVSHMVDIAVAEQAVAIVFADEG